MAKKSKFKMRFLYLLVALTETTLMADVLYTSAVKENFYESGNIPPIYLIYVNTYLIYSISCYITQVTKIILSESNLSSSEI